MKDYSDYSDSKLINLAVAKDELAFKELVSRHRGWAFGFVIKNVGQKETAWDITQEAFVRVYKNLENFRHDASFNTWFHRILYNLCIDHWRKSGRKIKTEYQDELSWDKKRISPAGDQRRENPEKSTKRREVLGLLQRALETLSAQHRNIIILREMEGMSYQKIAKIIDCPKGTVMSRLHHARKKIIEFMNKHGYSSSEI
ncbi:MAG: RNA polymerase sigma factor [Myxococcota bacterium]